MEVPRTALPSSDSSMQTSARAGTQPNVTGDDSTAIATLNETPSQPPTAEDTENTTIRTSTPRNEEQEQLLQWHHGEFSDDDNDEDRMWRESWNNLNDTRYNMYNIWSDLTARSQELTAQLNELSANVLQTTTMLHTLRHNFDQTNEVLGLATTNVRQNVSSDNSSANVRQNVSSAILSDNVGRDANATMDFDAEEHPPRSAEEEAIMAQARALCQQEFGDDDNARVRAREEADARIQRLPPQLQAIVQWYTEELERCSTPEIAAAVVKLDHMRQVYRSTENRESTPRTIVTLARTSEIPHAPLHTKFKDAQKTAKRPRSKQDMELVAAASKIHRREFGDIDVEQWMQDTEEERKQLPSEYQAAEARLRGVMDRCSTPVVAALMIEFDQMKQHRPPTPEIVALMNNFADKYEPTAGREEFTTTMLLAQTPEITSIPLHEAIASSANTSKQPRNVPDNTATITFGHQLRTDVEELRIATNTYYLQETGKWSDAEYAAAVAYINQMRKLDKSPETPPPSTSHAENDGETTPTYHELQKMRPHRHLHGLSRAEVTTICTEVMTYLACDDDILKLEWLTVLQILVEHGFPESFLRNIKNVYAMVDYVVLRSTQHPAADFWFSLRNADSIKAFEYVTWLAGHDGQAGLWNCHNVHILETMTRRPTTTLVRHLRKVDIKHGLSFPQEQQFYEGHRPKASICHRLLRNLTEPKQIRGVPSLDWTGLPDLQYRLVRAKEWVRFGGQGQFADTFRAYYAELPAGEPEELTPRNFVQFQPPANVTNDDMVIQTWLTNPPIAVLWQLPNERDQCTVLETKAHCAYPAAPADLLLQVLDLTDHWAKLRKLRFEVRFVDDNMASDLPLSHDIGIFCQDLVDAFFIRLLNVIRQSTRNIEIDVLMLGEFEIWGGDDEDHETAKRLTTNRFEPWNVTIQTKPQATTAKMTTQGPNFTAALNIHYASMNIGSGIPTPPLTFQQNRDRLQKLIEDQKYDA
ncbi:hypothetical protein AAVH_27311 [Aphelenchoides avenae]|nr:hypothetical protein AAVH_27311 [Aphelenchus avenae]